MPSRAPTLPTRRVCFRCALFCAVLPVEMPIVQHQQNNLLKFYVLPRTKKARFLRKFLKKQPKSAWGKGSSHGARDDPEAVSFR